MVARPFIDLRVGGQIDLYSIVSKLMFSVLLCRALLFSRMISVDVCCDSSLGYALCVQH